MNGSVDIFKFHREVMDRYQSFSRSFVDIDDPQIEAALSDEGRLNIIGWEIHQCPQGNPAFPPGTEPPAPQGRSGRRAGG